MMLHAYREPAKGNMLMLHLESLPLNQRRSFQGLKDIASLGSYRASLPAQLP